MNAEISETSPLNAEISETIRAGTLRSRKLWELTSLMRRIHLC